MKLIVFVPLLSVVFAVCGPTAPQKTDATPIVAVSPTLPPQVESYAIKINQPAVWSGAVSVINITEKTPVNVVWVNNDLKLAELEKNGSFADVDIMNCGGFLASGKMSQNERNEMRMELDPATIAADAVEKIKQCADVQESDEKFTTSLAFAVAPKNDQRKSIKTAKADTKKIFASLPTEMRSKNNSDLSRPTDQWADTDGDGDVDLIEISTTNGDNSAGEILIRREGKWTKIGKTDD